MAQMILHGRELIRINTQKNYIEFSTNDGRSWHTLDTMVLMLVISSTS